MAAMVTPGSVQGQSVSTEAAPVEWVRYAEEATGEITAWLREEGEIPVRLRGYLNEMSLARGKPVAIEIRLWIAGNGVVQRMAFSPFAHAQANADLERAIVGRQLGQPPVGMSLPMRVGVMVELEP